MQHENIISHCSHEYTITLVQIFQRHVLGGDIQQPIVTRGADA